LLHCLFGHRRNAIAGDPVAPWAGPIRMEAGGAGDQVTRVAQRFKPLRKRLSLLAL